MKEAVKHLLLAFLVVICLAFFAFFYITRLSPRARKALSHVENSKKLRVGMTQKEMLKIMGRPEDVRPSYFAANEILYFYTPPFLASSGIDISVGPDSTITHIVYFE